MAALATAVAAVHLITGWHSEGPVVFDDEGGYLRIARHLAGEGPPAGVRYFPGYSLLVVPIHWALGSTWAIFLGVKVLNAALGAATVALAYLASGYLLPPEQRWRRAGATALVSLYPSYLLFSNQALSENALVPASLLLAYLVARLLPGRPAVGAAAGLGAVAAYAVVVHPRAVGAVAALGVVVAVWWWPWHANWRRIVAVAVGLVVVAAAGLVLLRWERTGAPPGSDRYELSEVVGPHAGLEELRIVTVGAAGQVLYLVAATGGLVVLAALQVPRRLRSVWREGDRSPQTALVVYAALASLGVLATSAVSISPHPEFPRPDAVIYGRYNEGMLAPFLLVGTAALMSGRYRLWDRVHRRRSALPWLVGVAVLTAGAVELWQIDHLLRTHFANPFNVLALYPITAAVGGVDPVVLAALAVAAGGVLVAVAGHRPWVAVGLAVLAFAVLTARMAFFYLPRDHYDVRVQERVVAETTNAIDHRFGIECLGVDRVDQPIYHVQLYRWYVDRTRLVEFSSDWSEPEVPCGPLVVSSRSDLDEAYPGARLVAREGRGVESHLWVLAGELQEQLEREGMLS